MRMLTWIPRPPGEFHRQSLEVLSKLATRFQIEIWDISGLNRTEGERQ